MRTSRSSNCPLKVPESAFAPIEMAPAATHWKRLWMKNQQKKERKKDREQERKTESKNNVIQNNGMDEVQKKLLKRKISWTIVIPGMKYDGMEWNGMESDQALLLFLVPPLLLYSDLENTRHNNHIKWHF